MSAISLLTSSDPLPPGSSTGGQAATPAPGAAPAGGQFGDVLSNTVAANSAADNAGQDASQPSAADSGAPTNGPQAGSAGPSSLGTPNAPRSNATQNGGPANPDSGSSGGSQSAPTQPASPPSGGASAAPSAPQQLPANSGSNADQAVSAAGPVPTTILPPAIVILPSVPADTASTGDAPPTNTTASAPVNGTPTAPSASGPGSASPTTAGAPATSNPLPPLPAANAIPGAPPPQSLANLLNVPAYVAGPNKSQRTSASSGDALPNFVLAIADIPQMTPAGSAPSTSSATSASSTAEPPVDSKPDADEQPPLPLPGAAPSQLIAGLFNIQPAPVQPAPVQPVALQPSPPSRPRGAAESTAATASPPPALIAALEPVASRTLSAPSDADSKPQTPIAANVSTTESSPAAVPGPATPAVSGIATTSPLSLPGPIQVAAMVTPTDTGNAPTPNAPQPAQIASAAANMVAASATAGPDLSQGGQPAASAVAPLASAGDLSGASTLPFTVAGDSGAPPLLPADVPAGFTADNSQFISSTATMAAAIPGTSAADDPSNGIQNARPGPADQDGAQQPATGNPLLGAPPPSLQFLAAISTGQRAGAEHANPAQVVSQVAHALVSYRGGQELQLQLNPPDLGTVRVDVALHDGVLSARIETQSPTTQQILADNLSQLKDSLAQQGVSFDRIDVRLAGTETGFGGAGTADPSFARHGDSPPDQGAGFVMTEADDAVRSSSAPRVPVTRISRTSLDVTI